MTFMQSILRLSINMTMGEQLLSGMIHNQLFLCFGFILFFYQWQRFTQSQTQHYSRQACLTFPDAQDQQQARESKSHHVFANSLHTGLLTAVGISSVAEHLHGMQIPAD